MLRRRSFVPLTSALVSVVLVSSAPWRVRAAPAEPGKPPLAGSHSVGYAWRGMLVGARFLEVGEHLRRAGRRQQSGNWFGTVELVELLEDVASRVAELGPHTRLGVGDLSARRGGSIDGHGSHESGRDVDLGFFVRDASGQRVETDWVDFTAQGRAVASARPHLLGLRFDDRANWEVVRALLESSRAEIQHVFVASWLEHRLLREAERTGADAALRERAAAVMMQPRNALPHADHFHVRIYCPEDDRPLCLDVAPLWPWTSAARAMPPSLGFGERTLAPTTPGS